MRPSVLCPFLLAFWAGAFAAPVSADEGKKSPDPSLKPFIELDKAGIWNPFTSRKENMSASTADNGLAGLQALSYLQGFNPPSGLKNVVLYNKPGVFPGYDLFTSANRPGAELIDNNGTIVHRWRLPSRLVLDRSSKQAAWCRVRLLENGDLLALIPFVGLLKIDQASCLIWFKKITCHHDFDMDGEGTIYTFKVTDMAGLKVDWIVVLSPDGQIKKEISLYDLFKKYPDRTYIHEIDKCKAAKARACTSLKAYSPVPGDVFHSNAIQVLDGRWASKVPAFKKGNLLVSIRELGVIICIDPSQEKIVWLMDRTFWHAGQHFAKLLDNGHILLFDNLYGPGLSRVVEFDPADKKLVWDYAGPNRLFYSSYLGECYRLANGNTLIVEATKGHCLEVTPGKKIVWEFYNPNQIKNLGMMPDMGGHLRSYPQRFRTLIAAVCQMQRIPSGSVDSWIKKRRHSC